MKHITTNFLIDLISFFDLLGLIITGYIIKYILPPGSGGGHGHGFRGGRGPTEAEHIKDLLGMTRHEWGDIHFWLAVVFVVLMLAHIILHWGWIKNYVKSAISFKR